LHLRGLGGRAPSDPTKSAISRGPLEGAEAGVDSCARSVTHLRDALSRVLVVSLAPAADAANLRRTPGP